MPKWRIFLLLRAFIIALGGWGMIVPFYAVQVAFALASTQTLFGLIMQSSSPTNDGINEALRLVNEETILNLEEIQICSPKRNSSVQY